jgi:hypothetical protein
LEYGGYSVVRTLIQILIIIKVKEEIFIDLENDGPNPEQAHSVIFNGSRINTRPGIIVTAPYNFTASTARSSEAEGR